MRWVVAIAALLLCAHANSVTVWMCLERCGGNSTTIEENLQQIADNLDVIDTVAFETYNLGPNSTLVFNDNLTDVNPALQALGVRRFAMLSSYPYPPQFLDWMMELFANPQPFTDACVEAALARNLTGFDVDFEPTVDATYEQAVAYGEWLTEFSLALQQRANALVTVDAATWNPLWNFTILSNTQVSKIHTMSTYTSNFNVFEEEFLDAVNHIAWDKLNIGLETTTTDVYNLTRRFTVLENYYIPDIAIWDMPIPDTWWPFLRNFTSNSN
eukprot:m.64952 g.64952  ORF g.64952 m.64952 type:complete len:271 (-) comp49761_c0_seq1:114-926(-)